MGKDNYTRKARQMRIEIITVCVDDDTVQVTDHDAVRDLIQVLRDASETKQHDCRATLTINGVAYKLGRDGEKIRNMTEVVIPVGAEVYWAKSK